MGISKFFRYICERYPCILEEISENQILEFDNLYLDMNGILHTCSQLKDQDNLMGYLSEEEIFNNIFHYIDVLFSIIKPKKLLFLAVDGVAPRAKMNQQRNRRFRVAKEREMLENKMKLEGKKLPDTPRFDSNCITPGTEFMIRLQAQLEYYVVSRMSNNPLWRTCKVIFSGHKVPGEGEHKIVEYIRYMKGLPDYDPNLSYCLYGLDADLVILGLCTHERNFSILREEVVFGRKSRNVTRPEETKFNLLHLDLLKEYIDLEFQDLKNRLPFEYNLENIVDDWVLMGFILGNDFIPHLPHFHINKGALPILYEAYMEILPTLDGFLNEDGNLNIPRFQTFMKGLAKYELKAFEETHADLQYFAEKTGRKFTSEKSKSNFDKPQDPELGKLTNSVDELNFVEEEIANDYFDPEGDLEDQDDEEMFLQEFHQYKRDYYLKKLDYSEVTDDILRSQAEGYVRGLQWILHYYYHGCPSWSWYYPHHYAPCTSDIVNFKSVNLEFELGQPFLPYQQLLAVLPPASKDLLPKTYHSLMTSPDSPVKEYYPDDFETDLNGKQNEWEAVVLLPIINEGNLLKAMKECDNNLTQEEKRNNKHGPMLFYFYKSENLGLYRAPQYFPDVQSNHASVETVWRDKITSVSSKLKVKSTKTNLDVFFPGFPTFNYVQYKATKEKAQIRIFKYNSTSDSIVLTIVQDDPLETEVVAPELLDKTVYVKWPFLTEARVVAVADSEYLYTMSDNEWKKGKHSGEEKLHWSKNASNWSRHYAERLGINIGSIRVMIYAKTLRGMIFTPEKKGKFRVTKVWSEGVNLYPLQTIVKDIKVFEPSANIHKPEESFSVGSVVFSLSSVYYGCMGKVVECMEETSDRLKVELEVPPDLDIDKELLNQFKTSYHSTYVVGQLIGISPRIISKISGTILVDISSREEVLDRKPIVNIGLGMKFNKSQEYIPGYTKKDNYWLYSKKAVDVMKEYIIMYPNVIKYLCTRTKEAYIPQRWEIFPDPDGAEEIQKLIDWISNLECSKIKRVPCGSQVLEKDVILKLEEMIDSSPKGASTVYTVAKINQLFKVDCVKGGVPPVSEAKHQLLDRVISVKPYHAIPLGLRGYITGIYNAKNPEDVMYDILFDTQFPSGMTLNCSPGRGFRTCETSFINISFGISLHQLTKPYKKNRKTASASENSSSLLVRESTSAFAQWNLGSPVLPTADKEIPYQGIWSLLENVKSQDETEILKKMLKIEDDHKPKIEENVKNFFESLSKNPEKFMAVATNDVKMSKPQQSDIKKNLVSSFKSRNFPPLNFLLNKEETGLSVCKNQVQNQKELRTGTGKYEGMALQSAAEIASNLVDSSNRNLDILFVDDVKGKNQRGKIMDFQEKVKKSFFGDNELCQTARNIESVKSSSKPKGTNDKSNRGNKPLQQSQGKNNVPKMLPTPPPQWCWQYKNLHIDQNRHCHSDEYKWRPDSRRTDHLGWQQFHSDNQNNYDRSNMDAPCNSRNSNWRQQEDGTRNVQRDSRLGNEAQFNYGNRRHRSTQGELSQIGFLRPDVYHVGPANGYGCSQAHSHNSKVGSNSSYKLSGIVTEFIPLQALTKNRQRRPMPATSTIFPVQSTTSRNETQEEAAALPSVVQKVVKGPKEGPSSYKPTRKSKIAAKFDGNWDL